MYRTVQMEGFSRAYVKAIAAQAGCNPYRPEIDDDSIDLGWQGTSTSGHGWKCSLNARPLMSI